MNKRGIHSFAQDRENCALAARYAQGFVWFLPFSFHLKSAVQFLLIHAFLHPVRIALETKQPIRLWRLLRVFLRVMRDELPPLYRDYRQVEGDICVINGQKMHQVFQLAGAKAKGFRTFARQTHYFNSTARYHFNFVDYYDVYSPEQALLLGAKAKLLPLPAPEFNAAAQIILIASQPVLMEKMKLYAFAKCYSLRAKEKLIIRFHPKESEAEKQQWRAIMQDRPCVFMESDTPLRFEALKLCVSLNSALTIAMKKHAVPTICLVKCE